MIWAVLVWLWNLPLMLAFLPFAMIFNFFGAQEDLVDGVKDYFEVVSDLFNKGCR